MKRNIKSCISLAPLCACVLLLSGILPVLGLASQMSDPGQAVTMEMLAAPTPAAAMLERRAAASTPPGFAGAGTQPGTYPSQGIIDPLSEHNSEEPGVLVPLAQAASSLRYWMEAVDIAGPGTPLSDPSFEGTIFIPGDAAFEAASPLLWQGAAPRSSYSTNMLTSLQQEQLAAQLNSLTVPGAALKLHQLSPGSVLSTAEGGGLKVLAVRPDDGTARLQHLPSGAVLSIVESDIQSGRAVGHVVDSLLLPAQASEAGRLHGGPGGRYASAMSVLQDPVHQLLGFAGLVQVAGLADELSSKGAQLTLFVPSNEALRAFVSRLPAAAQRALVSDASLAERVVSGHTVPGVALGSKALLAVADGHMFMTQAGSLLHVQHVGGPLASQAPTVAAAAHIGGPRLIAEQGQQHAVAFTSPALLTVDGALITTLDLLGGKAVVHVIDTVLIPPDTAAELGIKPTSAGPDLLRALRRASSAASLVCATAVQLAGVAAAAVALSA